VLSLTVAVALAACGGDDKAPVKTSASTEESSTTPADRVVVELVIESYLQMNRRPAGRSSTSASTAIRRQPSSTMSRSMVSRTAPARTSWPVSEVQRASPKAGRSRACR